MPEENTNTLRHERRSLHESLDEPAHLWKLYSGDIHNEGCGDEQLGRGTRGTVVCSGWMNKGPSRFDFNQSCHEPVLLLSFPTDHMASRASDNLQCYMREAKLPVMAYRFPRGESNVSFRVSLNVRPERYRKLRLVHTINAALFGDIISDWVEGTIPCKSLGVNDEDERTGERLTVPCDPFFSIVPLPLARAEDIERVFLWVDMFPLESIRRILGLLYPDSKSWKWLACEEGPFLKVSTWSYKHDSRKSVSAQHALCMFLTTPWVLSEEDLQEFARGQSYPDRSSLDSLRNEEHSTFRGNEWLWSKVWDTCISRDSPWFVITTYTHWVFGVFSAGWSATFVTPVYAFDSRTPAILETLTYWLISAMGYPDGFAVPEIPHETIHHKQLLVATPRDISREEPAEALAVMHV